MPQISVLVDQSTGVELKFFSQLYFVIFMFDASGYKNADHNISFYEVLLGRGRNTF